MTKTFRVTWQETVFLEAVIDAEDEERAIQYAQLNSIEELGGTEDRYFDDEYGFTITPIEGDEE